MRAACLLRTCVLLDKVYDCYYWVTLMSMSMHVTHASEILLHCSLSLVGLWVWQGTEQQHRKYREKYAACFWGLVTFLCEITCLLLLPFLCYYQISILELPNLLPALFNFGAQARLDIFFQL